MPTVHIGANADPHTEHPFGFFRRHAVGESLTGTPRRKLLPAARGSSRGTNYWPGCFLMLPAISPSKSLG